MNSTIEPPPNTTIEPPPVLSAEVIDLATLPDAKPIAEHFSEFLSQFKSLAETARTLTVRDEHDVGAMRIARETRLALRQIRIAVDKRREELKEEPLRRCQQIDAAARTIRESVSTLEVRCEKLEKYALLLAQEKMKRLAAERRAILLPLDPTPLSDEVLSAMPQDHFDARVKDLEFLKEKREEEARAREAERIRREQEAEAERVRLKEENERLQREAAEREKAQAEERARVEDERRKAEEAARIEREKLEAEKRAAEEKVRLEREKAEKEAAEAKAKAEAEKAKLEKQIAEQKRKAEEAAKAVEAERVRAMKEKADAEFKRMADEAAAEKARLAKEKAEADKPVADKIFLLAQAIQFTERPKLPAAVKTRVDAVIVECVAQLGIIAKSL